MAQARNLFMVDASAENPPSVQEIDELAKNLLASQLDVWSEQGYVKLDGGQVLTSAEWKNGQLKVNNHVVNLPPAPETVAASKP